VSRICYISPLSIHAYRWIEALSDKGYQISLITDFRYWVSPTIRSIPVYNQPMLNKRNVLWRYVPNNLRVTKALKRVDPDFVHLHVQHHYIPAIFLSGIPFMLSSWGIEVLKLPHSNIFSKGLAKMVATKAGAVTVDAECLKEIWIGLGVPKSKIEVIPFGVDTKIFNSDVDGARIREKLRIDSRDVVVISTRPFYNHHYNVECLVRAMPLVTKAWENVKFIIKGSGPLEEYFKNLAEKLGVAEHVRFVGLVPYKEMPQFLSAADIYVSTCFIDSTSVSLLEAMACEKAPVVTDIAGNREWIEDGVNGFLFPPEDSEALAEKIICLVENQELRETFGRRCSKIVRNRGTWEQAVSKMQAIYEMLLKR